MKELEERRKEGQIGFEVAAFIVGMHRLRTVLPSSGQVLGE